MADEMDSSIIKEDDSIYPDEPTPIRKKRRLESCIDETSESDNVAVPMQVDQPVPTQAVQPESFVAEPAKLRNTETRKYPRLVSLINSHSERVQRFSQLSTSPENAKKSFLLNSVTHFELIQEAKKDLEKIVFSDDALKAMSHKLYSALVKSDEFEATDISPSNEKLEASSKEILPSHEKAVSPVGKVELKEAADDKLDISDKQSADPNPSKILPDSSSTVKNASRSLQIPKVTFIADRVRQLIDMCDKICRLENQMSSLYITSATRESHVQRAKLFDIIDDEYCSQLQLLISSDQIDPKAAKSFREKICEIKQKLLAADKSVFTVTGMPPPDKLSDLFLMKQALLALWPQALHNNALLAQGIFRLLDWYLLAEPESSELRNCIGDIKEIGHSVDKASHSITSVINGWNGCMDHKELLELSYLRVAADFASDVYVDLLTQMWLAKLHCKSLLASQQKKEKSDKLCPDKQLDYKLN